MEFLMKFWVTIIVMISAQTKMATTATMTARAISTTITTAATASMTMAILTTTAATASTTAAEITTTTATAKATSTRAKAVHDVESEAKQQTSGYAHRRTVYFHRQSASQFEVSLKTCRKNVAALFTSMTCNARDSLKNSIDIASNSSADIQALAAILGSHRTDLLFAEICRAGYRTDSRVASCVPCEAGSFSSVGGLSSCMRCPKGSVSAQAASVCDTCLPGRYASSNSSECLGCTPGKYQPGVGASTGCEECEAGRYSSTMDATQCFACPEGQFQHATSSINCILCAVGRHQPSKGEGNCTNCPRGRYGPVEGAQACASCPPGQYQNGLGKQTCNHCSPGYFQASRGETAACSKCPPGRFAVTSGANACSQCPEGRFQNQTGKSTCALCEVGKFQSSLGSEGGCVSCDKGKYAGTMGARRCALCPKGQHQLFRGRSICVLCKPGFAKAVRGKASCSECTIGTYAPTSGSSVCTNCTGGLALTAGASQCKSCQPGKFAVISRDNSTKCFQCPAGYYNPAHGASACMPCFQGMYAHKKGMSLCKACNPGYFSATSASPRCTGCAKGRFSHANGSRSCLDCYSGTFANVTGLSQCHYCPVDTFSNRSAFSCFKCPVGYASDEGSAECAPCPRGKYFDHTKPWLKCQLCQPGKFSSCTGQNTCDACEVGYFARKPGMSACDGCPVGRFAKHEQTIECERCSPGTFAHAEKQSKCLDCSKGQFSTNKTTKKINGTYKLSKCVKCPAGKMAEEKKSSVCASCSPGFYNRLEGQSSCDPCPPGRHQPGKRGRHQPGKTGRTCDPCPPKTFSLMGSRDCTACKLGEVQPTHSNMCFRCFAGTYSVIPGEHISEKCHPCPEGGFCGGGSMRLPRRGYWSARNENEDAWRLGVDGQVEFVRCRNENACPGALVSGLKGMLLPGDPRVHLRFNGSWSKSSVSGELVGGPFGGVVPGMMLAVGDQLVFVSPKAVILCEEIEDKDACQYYDVSVSDAVKEQTCKWKEFRRVCESVYRYTPDGIYVTRTHIPLVEYNGSYVDASTIAVLPRGQDETAYQNCTRGYTGVKCAQCVRGYFKDKYLCKQCPKELLLSWLSLVGGLLVVTGYMVFIGRQAVATARDEADSFSVSLKILMGWFQMTKLALAFDVPWPASLFGFLETQSYVSGYADQALLSVDCVLQTILAPTMPIPLYIKLFFIVLPILFAVLACLFWGGMYIFQALTVRRAFKQQWENTLALAKARDKVLFDVMKKARAEVEQGDSEAKKRTENELQAKLSFERREFTHHVLETLDLGFKEYQLADMESQLLSDPQLKHRDVKVVGGRHVLERSLTLPPPTRTDAKLYRANQTMRVKRYTDDVNSDTGDGVQRPNSRALSASVRQRCLMQRILRRFKGTIQRNDVAGLEMLARYMRKSIFSSLATNIKRKLVVTLIVIFFFLHPHVSERTFELLACDKDIYGSSRLHEHLDMLCDYSISSAYFPWFLVACTSVVFFVIGIPMFALVMLTFHSHSLDTDHTRHMFGFLYLGYEPQFYMWEIWVIFRKALVFMLIVLLSTQGPNFQMISALLLLLVSILLQVKAQPYLNGFFDWLEIVGLGACTSIFFTALYLYNVELFEKEWIGALATILTILLNVVFLWNWLKLAALYLIRKLNEYRNSQHTERVRRISGFHAFIRPLKTKPCCVCEACSICKRSEGEDENPEAPLTAVANKVTPMNTVAPKTRLMLPTVTGRVGNDYLTEVEVPTISLDHGEVEETSIVYVVGDKVECRLEDDPASGYIYPSDRRLKSLDNRWFKGSITAIRRSTKSDVEDDLVGVNEDYVIVVDLPSNLVDKILSPIGKCFRRCFSTCQIKCPCFNKLYKFYLQKFLKGFMKGIERRSLDRNSEVKQIKETVLQHILPPPHDEEDDHIKHVTMLANVFQTVDPVFNAVADATTTAEVEDARGRIRKQRIQLEEQQFALDATQVALREVEEQLETIDVSEEVSPSSPAAFTESKVIATVNPMQVQELSQDLNEYERRDNLLMEVEQKLDRQRLIQRIKSHRSSVESDLYY